jgi:hypothetical protein
MLIKSLVALFVLSNFSQADVNHTEAYEFVGGGRICVDADDVVRAQPHHEPLARGRLVGLEVQANVTTFTVQKAADYPKHDYYADLVDFIDGYPDSARLDPTGTFYQVDVSYLPVAEVDSSRLRDVVIPGDGTNVWIVSASIREFVNDRPRDNDSYSGIFHALCGLYDSRREPDGNPFCLRQFPFSVFTVRYVPDNRDWLAAIARDAEVRAEFEAAVDVCPLTPIGGEVAESSL